MCVHVFRHRLGVAFPPTRPPWGRDHMSEIKKIFGEAKPVRGLLSGTKYSLDYYQREYKWQTKQISELLGDLTDKFLGSYDPSHARSAVADYDYYFLGSIVLSRHDGATYIIDGQQRLTTLTLLLIHLHNLQRERSAAVDIKDLIFSEKYGKRSFNMDVKERESVMDALFQGQAFDPTGRPESVANITARYQDVEANFSDELLGDALPFFIDWLIENVYLVEISTSSDEDAYTIFETMNDRGLSLSPTDMLKGYLLANISAQEDRARANDTWKRTQAVLNDLAKDEDADFLKAWLRGQHAVTIRQRSRGATPEDFDLIGTEFHRWVRDHKATSGSAGARTSWTSSSADSPSTRGTTSSSEERPRRSPRDWRASSTTPNSTSPSSTQCCWLR